MYSSFLLCRYGMSRYRLQNCRCIFFNWWVIPSLKFRLSIHTPDFTIVIQNRGDHCKILRARYGLSLLKSVYLIRLKRAWSAFSFRWPSVTVKFLDEEIRLPKYVHTVLLHNINNLVIYIKSKFSAFSCAFLKNTISFVFVFVFVFFLGGGFILNIHEL